jgi:hypothetical protein
MNVSREIVPDRFILSVHSVFGLSTTEANCGGSDISSDERQQD